MRQNDDFDSCCKTGVLLSLYSTSIHVLSKACLLQKQNINNLHVQHNLFATLTFGGKMKLTIQTDEAKKGRNKLC